MPTRNVLSFIECLRIALAPCAKSLIEGQLQVDAKPDVGAWTALRMEYDAAVKFTRDATDPRIEIGGESNNNVLRIWVRDNGAGFDSERQDQIFDMFQRLHQADDFPSQELAWRLCGERSSA